MQLALIFSLIAIYCITLYLVWSVYKSKQRVVKEIVYVPMLDDKLAKENKDLQSKLYSSEIRFDNLKKNYEKSLSENKKLKEDIEVIYNIQNRYKDKQWDLENQK